MAIRSIDELHEAHDLAGKRVLVRVDFNVPLGGNRVMDDTRIQAALPTLRLLLEHGASLVLASHLGRPGGQRDPALSLEPVAQHLGSLLDHEIRLAPDSVGEDTERAAATLEPGQILLLENTRFHPGEKANDGEYASALTSLADCYVNDAFATLHRAHASTVGVAGRLPSAAGLLVARELAALGRAASDPARPYVVIVGGAKVSDKLPAIESLLVRADRVLVGGGVANTFLAARGTDVADSLFEPEYVSRARTLMEQAGDDIVLPADVLIAERPEADAATRIMDGRDVDTGWQIVDIGPETIALYASDVKQAATVFWSGPLGRYECEPLAKGTFEVARALAGSDGFVIVGGGETAAAMRAAGVADLIDHVSTGGGASLAYLCGEKLPGLEALETG